MKRAFLLFPLAIALCTTLSASGQFNGPAIVTGGTLNQPTTVTVDQQLLYPAAHDVQLSQGDLITVRIFGQTDYASGIRIGSDGKALLPLLGVVSLEGLSVTAAEELIASRLDAAGMYKNPQVTIQVVEGPNAVITVVGEAHGVIPVTGPRRLLDILAAAGGLPMTASHVLTIDRPGQPQPLVVDLGTDPVHSALANVPVFPGDTILVARMGIVYVIGAFKTQGVVPLAPSTPLTLMEAAALSGGPTFEAKMNDLRLIRTVGDQRTVVKLDMKKILYGQAPDPILQANDILFLPQSAFKASITNGSIGTALGVVSLLISTLSYTR
jgi:polysaccharide export outer membrane protein